MNSSSRRTRLTALAAAGVTATLAACWDSPTDARLGLDERGPSFATLIEPTDLVPWTPPQDANGIYLLPKACDVFIGQEIIAGGPKRFTHQLLVHVPTGARVKLVNKADYPDGFFPAYPVQGTNPAHGIQDDPIIDLGTIDPSRAGYKVFRCSAADQDDPTRPVVEPVTDHAGKGDGIMIETDGVTLDLNGFGLVASPSATDLDPRYDNLGIVVGASGSTLTNSATVGGDGRSGVAFFTGFGHSIELEGNSPTVQGRDPATNGGIYNIETAGGTGAKLSSGNVLVEYIKTIDEDPIIGVGFEVLRCPSGSVTTVRNNYFVGAGEGIFVRRCDNVKVVLENNIVSAPNGYGIYAREVNGSSSVADRRLQILNNTIRNSNKINSATGIHLDFESSYITVTGNTIGGFYCGIQVANNENGNRIAGVASNGTLQNSNTFDADVDPKICGGTYVPPSNNPPVITLSAVEPCDRLTCTFNASATDPDVGGSITRHEWNFGDGTGVKAVEGPVPATTQYTFPRAGTFLVTLRAFDNHNLGAEAQTTVVLEVAPNLAPTAEFEIDCEASQCTFTSVSSDPEGGTLAHSWDFGDGTAPATTAPTATHTYADGTYVVTLTVTDQGGLSAQATSVTLRMPNARPVAVINTPIQCTDLTCTFSSGSYDPDTDLYGGIGVWEWAFLTESGSSVGRSSDQNPTFTFPAYGTYIIRHGVRDLTETASNEVRETITLTAPANQLPIADFTSTCTDLTCAFTSTSSDPEGNPLQAYSWTFGDGATSTLQDPSHTYTAAGEYSVTLTVTDDQGGTGTVTKTVTVTAPANTAPKAAFMIGGTGLSFTFTDASTDTESPIAGWLWNFGNSTNPVTTQGPHTVTYAAGIYTVTLEVTDAGGLKNSVAQEVIAVGTITAKGKKNNNGVNLSWGGAVGPKVDIERTFNGATTVLSVDNTGSYQDRLTIRGKYTYRVCNQVVGTNATTKVCSAPFDITY